MICFLHLRGKNVRPGDYRVAFGMHITTSPGTRQIIDATSVTLHNGYNSNTMANDIAVLSKVLL
jgi:hypothetical protein